MAPTGIPAMRRAVADGYLDAVIYDPEGAQPFPMIDASNLGRFAPSAGLQRDARDGVVLAIVEDCAGRTIEGATIHIAGGAEPLYLGADTRFDPRLTATSTDSAALIFGVPPGEVDVEVEFDGTTFSSFAVTVLPDTLVTVPRRP